MGGKLLAQGQVLEGELAMAAEDEGEESKQVEQESDNRAEDSLRISTDRSTTCPRAEFWRRPADEATYQHHSQLLGTVT
jgi:hypothetical protein